MNNFEIKFFSQLLLFVKLKIINFVEGYKRDAQNNIAFAKIVFKQLV